MIKFIAFRLIRSRLKIALPLVNSKFYKKLFTLSYKLFFYLKPSQLWIIVLALLNKTEFKKIISIPSLLILFSSLFSYPAESKIDTNNLFAKLDANGFMKSENNWDVFFWVLITLALIKRFILFTFKLFWIPFKIALTFDILKYFGFYFSYIFDSLNNLSLGIIDWFYNKIIKFWNFFYNNDNKFN